MIERLEQEYFDWLCDLVCRNRYAKNISYRKLLTYLHDTEFRYLILRDENRAKEGVDLRYRFDDSYPYVNKRRPCSVLEMMVAIAVRCEEEYMDDPTRGDRTSQWFWGMIVNLGLGSMTDDRFDLDIVEEAIERLLDREYEADGEGGLFTVRNCEFDLRDIEIWDQLCLYLNEIT
jgi:hypothetical protein